MTTFKYLVETLNESSSFSDDAKLLNSHGFAHNNPGGRSYPSYKEWVYAHEDRQKGRHDHLRRVFVDRSGAAPKYTAHYGVSREYWGSRWNNPFDHHTVHQSEHSSAQDAVDALAKVKHVDI